MRTITQIQKLIQKEKDYLQTVTGDYDKIKKAETKTRKILIFYRDCIKYLETNPTEDFINAEKERLSALVDLVSTRSMEIRKKKDRNAYLSEMGNTKLKAQLNAVKFLLEQ